MSAAIFNRCKTQRPRKLLDTCSDPASDKSRIAPSPFRPSGLVCCLGEGATSLQLCFGESIKCFLEMCCLHSHASACCTPEDGAENGHHFHKITTEECRFQRNNQILSRGYPETHHWYSGSQAVCLLHVHNLSWNSDRDMYAGTIKILPKGGYLGN